MIIIGIDPGLQTLGYGILEVFPQKKEKIEVIDFGCIITDSFLPAGERLKKIHKELSSLIKKYGPDLVSVESLFFFKNLKTVMPVSQAKGVVLLVAAQNKLPVLEFTPLQVKMAIAGYGRAEKKQVQEMIKKIVCLDDFDLKKNYRKKDDAFDALGVAICAYLKAY